MQEVVQQIVAFRFFILWVVWFGGLGVVSLRLLPRQQAYYQHFSLMDRSKAMWQRQADPELEQLRRAVWRGYGYGILWGLGFPLITVGALQLLAVVGLPHTP